MIKSVRIKFDKFLHDTGKAILVRIDGIEHWIPIKLCRKLIINNKLGGNVCIPSFFYERMGYEVTEDLADITVIHHVPKKEDKTKIEHDDRLFK